MKTPLPIPHPVREQELLRLFAAGTGPTVKPELQYLAFPVYHHRADGKVLTFAGDGRVFIWTAVRVPGFADYIVPPAGFGYVSLPEILNKPRTYPQDPAPPPSGVWTSGQCDDIFVGQTIARVRRSILARLAALDTCRLGNGETHVMGGMSVGWKHIAFAGTFGRLHLQGIILCEPPLALRRSAGRRARKSTTAVS